MSNDTHPAVRRVMLVHGTLTTAQKAWRRQTVLDQSWDVVLPERRGYRSGMPRVREDFRTDATDLAALLTEPTHVVAHSYGCLGSLLAASTRPSAVASLTLVEPTFYGILGSGPIAEARSALEQHFGQAELSSSEFLQGFFDALNVPVQISGTDLPEPLGEQTSVLRSQVPPWELSDAEIAPWGDGPTLLVSGGHSSAFDAICAHAAQRLNAGLVTLRGAGHAPQELGPEFNDTLEQFWMTAATR